MSREQVGIEAGLGHAAGNHSPNGRRRHSRTLKDLTRHLDAEVDRRHKSQNGVVLGKWGTHSIEQPDVVIL